VDAKVPTDRETGRPRGFAFVEFDDEAAVQKCISSLNGSTLKGRPLRVSEAEDRPPRPPGAGPRPGPRPFRPGGEPFRGGVPMEPPPFSENRESRRRNKFTGKPTEARPFNKEKGPRRVERRRGPGKGFDEDEDY
jgi:RNA recognition motif-containing protein